MQYRAPAPTIAWIGSALVVEQFFLPLRLCEPCCCCCFLGAALTAAAAAVRPVDGKVAVDHGAVKAAAAAVESGDNPNSDLVRPKAGVCVCVKVNVICIVATTDSCGSSGNRRQLRPGETKARGFEWVEVFVFLWHCSFLEGAAAAVQPGDRLSAVTALSLT